MAQETRPMMGRGPRGGARGPRPKVDNAGKTIKRLMSYVGKYKIQFAFVIVCIIVSAIANVQGSLFIQKVIDDYITPMLATGSRDFTAFAGAIVKMGIIFAVGIFATLFYNRTMVSIVAR